MLHIERFQCNMLSENCYVVSDETKECVIIGGGISGNRIHYTAHRAY